MNWKQDVDALVESTMPRAEMAAEQALADTSNPILTRSFISPMVWPELERDEIWQRIASFRAHQKKMAREREDYYLETKARMLASLAGRSTDR